MTDQEVFDRVATHLLTQKRKARDSELSCQYRNAEGLKCAVGCLIPDSDYTPKMEGHRVAFLIVNYDSVRSLFVNINPELLYDLQSIHDSQDPAHWRSSLARAARVYKLDGAVVEKF